MHDTLTEAQTYQSIGQPSPELSRVTGETEGWLGAAAEPQKTQMEAHDISFWNKRSNLRALATNGDTTYARALFDPGAGAGIPGFVDHDEGPVAAYGSDNPTPFTGYAEDGIITGATAGADAPASPPYPK